MNNVNCLLLCMKQVSFRSYNQETKMRNSSAQRSAVRGTDPDSKSSGSGGVAVGKGTARYSDHVNPLVIKNLQGESDIVSV
jgi:hypothetical protein